ncbi:hypothetical protein O9993_03910 [Vibrio lentus]|nr:hypothetical protein [Vibrio lentus]
MLSIKMLSAVSVMPSQFIITLYPFLGFYIIISIGEHNGDQPACFLHYNIVYSTNQLAQGKEKSDSPSALISHNAWMRL